MESPRCDLCGADDPETLFAGSTWQQAFDLPIRLVRCRVCGLVYLSPRPDRQEIGRYYTEDYPCYRLAAEDESSAFLRFIRRRNQAKRRKMVEKILGQNSGQVLDVGCSTGLFLHEMQSAGWKTFGIEPNPTAAQYARQRFNLALFEGYLADAPLEEHSFDLVTYWDVLEHTFSPRQELERTAWLLKPGGMLVINIPNWKSFDRTFFGPHWVGYDPPRHFYVFPEATLRALLESVDLKIVATACFIPSYHSFKISLERWMHVRHPGLFQPIRRLLSFPGARILFEPFFLIRQRFQRGDVITVFARKASR